MAMKVIYEPKGRAAEYSPLAANLYRGCSHGCGYCYVPGIIRMNRKQFTVSPHPRPDILKHLERDAAKFAEDSRRVLLSFTSDPYQPVEATLRITRQAIGILNSHDLAVTVLTKGGLLPSRDFDLLSQNPRNEYAVSLTTDSPTVSAEWEPGAASAIDRINGLWRAAEAGIRTWVSFEPVIDPRAVFRLLDFMDDIPDEIRVGKLNHVQNSTDWVKFREEITERLEKLGKPFKIKEDLRKARRAAYGTGMRC